MSFDASRDIQFLVRTPAAFRTMLGGLPRELVGACYGPGTWSPHEILGHLIHGDRTDWIPRARHILERGETVAFVPFDRQGHAGLCKAHDTAALLDLFEVERAACVAQLRALPLSPSSLSRRGRHPALGRVTLSELLCAWVVHDLNHIAQVAKALAFQRRADVGPWEAYLSILAPPAPR